MRHSALIGFFAGLAAGNLLATLVRGERGEHGDPIFSQLKSECDGMLHEMEEKLENIRRRAQEKFNDNPVDMRFTV